MRYDILVWSDGACQYIPAPVYATTADEAEWTAKQWRENGYVVKIVCHGKDCPNCGE